MSYFTSARKYFHPAGFGLVEMQVGMALTLLLMLGAGALLTGIVRVGTASREQHSLDRKVMLMQIALENQKTCDCALTRDPEKPWIRITFAEGSDPKYDLKYVSTYATSGGSSCLAVQTLIASEAAENSEAALISQVKSLRLEDFKKTGDSQYSANLKLNPDVHSTEAEAWKYVIPVSFHGIEAAGRVELTSCLEKL